MTTTDTDTLTERIARVLHEIDPITGHGHDWGKLANAERKFYRHKAAAVLPIVAVEVRKAQAEAWDEGGQDAIHGFDIEDRYTDPINPYREAGDGDERR